MQKIDMSTRSAYYQYDNTGERFYKNYGSKQILIQNGITDTIRTYSNPALYASPYLVITPQGYTKHYFAGTDRFLSKIGDGNFTALNTHAATSAQIAAKLTAVKAAAPDSIIPNKFTFLRSLTNNQKDHPVLYWQHSDHLGSASWITDTNGTGIQRLLYMPFGEPLYDYRNTSYNSRYTFSGKERDTETGYSYFGARYYNSDLSIWLSVDPMADKYPGLSPYTYCANNPVKLVDEDGRFPIDVHTQMVNNALATKSYYFTPIRSHILRGAGIVADISNMF